MARLLPFLARRIGRIRMGTQMGRFAILSTLFSTTTSGGFLLCGVRVISDWRLLANGHLDQLLYERRQIDTELPFAELRARSNITERAKSAGNSPDFSARIRD